MDDLISRQAAVDAILAVTGNSSVRELYEHVQEHGLSDMWSGGVNAAIDIIIAVPSAQPTEASCWGCNCQKMERLKEQKTFSEMVHLHDAETHEERTETHTCDLISRQAAINAIENTDCELPPYAWNELTDAIMKVPSEQPEHTNSWYINSWCIDCKEYDTENKCCPRYSRVIKQTLDDAYRHGETEAEARFHDVIVRCKDCLMHGVCRFEQGLGLNGYCSQAERRTDD